MPPGLHRLTRHFDAGFAAGGDLARTFANPSTDDLHDVASRETGLGFTNQRAALGAAAWAPEQPRACLRLRGRRVGFGSPGLGLGVASDRRRRQRAKHRTHQEPRSQRSAHRSDCTDAPGSGELHKASDTFVRPTCLPSRRGVSGINSINGLFDANRGDAQGPSPRPPSGSSWMRASPLRRERPAALARRFTRVSSLGRGHGAHWNEIRR